MPEATRTTLKPAHKAIQSYYANLQSYRELNVAHETGVRTAFQNMLTETARLHKWTLITEQTLKVSGKQIRPDGVTAHRPHCRHADARSDRFARRAAD